VSAVKGVGLLTGHNHESRFQSSHYLNELKKDPNSIDSQPKPIFETDSVNSMVTLNDQEQTLTIYDPTLKKVAPSLSLSLSLSRIFSPLPLVNQI
jgi:hypothetical protein